ncbi:hypothetical protein F4820DRAFT_465278 [Hypoxylon rubiginosum]|uniref:Uncharacterized protein n=1 Tax=Hypoxylon rubiginosum TaxID=110542 RepID=A0ACB9ZAP8_9PEZI|nr:hypothetical protein F4820DRAFT_465278 [Hypoxylon rubiginosum]
MSLDLCGSERIDWIEQSLDQVLDPDNDIDSDSGFSHKGAFAIHLYKSLFESLRELAERSAAIPDESEDTLENFDRAVQLLDRIPDALAKEDTDTGRQQLISFPMFYYFMWIQLEEFARAPFAALKPVIVEHLMRMTDQVERLATPPKDVWPALSEITNRADQHEAHKLKTIFEAFMNLRYLGKPARDEDACVNLVNKSKLLTTMAAVVLRMPAKIVEISNDSLYDDSIRPTYIDHRFNSEESSFGLGRRPGLVELSEKLGNTPIPPEVIAKLEAARAKGAAPAVEEEEEEEEEEEGGAVPDVLSTISDPARRNRTVFADDRAEQRREVRFTDAAKVQALGPPDAAKAAEKAENYALEDQLTEKAIKEFNRHGPPGIDHMHAVDTFDMLLYMVVVTHWRCYQLVELYEASMPQA